MSIGSILRAAWACCVAATLAVVAVGVPSAWAQDEPQQDAPARVGRISDVSGELFLATAERANDWAPIGRNYPVTSGDNLWIGASGRAEVDFGAGRFWMAGDSNLQVVALDERQLALFVASGQIIVQVRTLDPGEVASVETPNTRIDIVRPGHYRIDVLPDLQRTVLSVRDGEAGVAFAGGVQQALAGQQVSVSGDNGTQIAIRNGFGSDAFDAWSVARGQRYDASQALNYVAPDMVGARDLDDYGTWENLPSYGAVWFPTTVAVGWAPYRFGDWAWVAPWGWTWVDSAPWGYAPSHYGRWAWVGGRWGWCPGARIARAAWAPALVGWYGGRQWANAAGPVYGWVPLGWGEPFNPGWGRCGGRCWRRYNQPYGVAQAERPSGPPPHYANANVPGALTAVPASILADARPVAANLINVSALGGGPAPVLGGAPGLRPPPGRIVARPVRAAPVPAGTQYQMMTRSAPPPTAVVLPQTAPQPAAPSGTGPPRRALSPVVPTPGQGGIVVAAPPSRDLRGAAPTPSAAPVAVAPAANGSLPAGRGAYTGAPPTPGPKAAPSPERGVSVVAPVVPGTMTRNGPATTVVQPVAPPRATPGVSSPEGESRAAAIVKPGATPQVNSGVAGATPGTLPPLK